jgi:GNAT superfamily N-acetyltransferase
MGIIVPMNRFMLRTMRPDEATAVAHLVHTSTNAWYQQSRNRTAFACPPDGCLLFPAVYESLDPGCCLVVEDTATGRIAASCFYHPRSTHVSVGIVNVHPDYFGKGLARLMMQEVLSLAQMESKPVRLVSSAMNLDSFSLYTRLGFVPRQLFQDMIFTVPESGLGVAIAPQVRPATLADVAQIATLERQISGIERENDWRYFITNALGIWKVFVYVEEGQVRGVLGSVCDSASHLVGPGVMENEAIAEALLTAQLDALRGETMVFLVPCDAAHLVQAAYRLGARNCEMHVAQVNGEAFPIRGITMPTFMPETG